MSATTRLRRILFLLSVMLVLTVHANARIGLVVGEPFGSFGTMMPSGHAGIYLDRLCADTPTHLRPCHPGEFGVVISRYHDLRHPDTDWMATPASVFFYGVEDPSAAPQYMTASLESELREAYREAHLLDVAPDRIDSNGVAHIPHYGDWDEAIGAAFDRRLFLYTIETTPEQDANILNLLNDSPDRRRYSLFRANCADFAAEVLNTVLPETFHRNNIADFQMMSPKQDAKLLQAYGNAHLEANLAVYEIPQIPGTLRRSRPIRGAAETLLKTKRYLATLLVIQPEIVLGSWIIYEAKGKSTPGLNAQPISYNFWKPQLASNPVSSSEALSPSPAPARHSPVPSPAALAAP
jgi:hypothetical protein